VGLALQIVAAAYRTPSAALRADLAGGAFASALDELAYAVGLPAPAMGDADESRLAASHAALFVSHLGGVAAPPYVGFAVDLPDHVAAVAEAGALLLEAGPRRRRARPARAVPLPWFQRYAPRSWRRTSAASTGR
jgi:hypothetical protein